MTFKEVARLAGKAAGKEGKVVTYDPVKMKACIYVCVSMWWV